MRGRPGPPEAAAPSGLEVRSFSGSGDEWDRFIVRCEHATFCHLWAWRDLMEGVLGQEACYLAALNAAGEIEGVLPLVEVRSVLTGRYLVSLPFLNHGGPVGSPAAQAALCDAARRRARESGVGLLELRARHTVAAPLRRCDRKISVLLELPSDPDLLWRGFRSKVRSQIRRPQKAGMEVRFGDGEMEAFYRVFATHMRDLGTPVLPRALFESIRERLADHVTFAAVYRAGRPVAGGCGFRWRDEFELTWASSLRAHARAAPNMLLYWGLMERLARDGVTLFDFGRCTPGSGTHRFKRQWGGEDRALPWLQWPVAEGGEAFPSERTLFRLASSVWRRVPLPVANRVGPFLARRLP